METVGLSLLEVFSQGGPVHPSRAYFGLDRALGLPALYSCVRLLAESLASLPIKIYTRAPGQGSAARYTGPSIFDRPSTSANTFDWVYQCMTSLLLQGNAWGFITGRDGFGYPTGIDWIPPDMVNVMDDEQQPWNPLRTRVYVYGRLIENWRDELFHIRAFTVAGRTQGISPLRHFANTVMGGLETQQYGNDFFANGGFPPGSFQNKNLEVDADAAAAIKETLVSAIRTHQPLVYGADWEFKAISIPPAEAQFIETQQMNATLLASIFGLPPDRVGGKRGDSLTYNCTDAETEILTKRGWLKYDQVTSRDICLGLNTETGMAEWQPVQKVHVFNDGPYPVTRLENKSHSSVTTPDHRWPVMILGRKDARDGYQWRTTETLPWDARICAAAPVATPPEPKWSDAITELVAWFWTEGWHNEYGSVTLAQSARANPQNVSRIRSALTEVFGPSGELQVRSVPSWREDHDARGLVHFRLNAKAGRLLLEHAPGKIVSTEFLSQLSRAQLELFVQVSLEADGSRHGASWTMGQKDKARLEAFQIACALTGRSGVIQGPNKHGMYVMPIQISPWRKPKGHAEYVTNEVTNLVWCVSTPTRTWFARRNGTCYFTGNTVEQSTLQVIEALRPWMVRLENAFFDILPANRYVRFNADALLKTDLRTRTEIYQIQRNMGVLNVDEIRDLEDMAPLPGAAGGENIPLQVMVAMAHSIKGIPNSMLKGLTLEIDLIADKLEQLQKEGIAKPDVEPAAKAPSAVLAQVLGNTRDAGSALEDLVDFLRKASQEGKARIREERAGPEFVGPWIPHDPRPGQGEQEQPGAVPDGDYRDQARYTASRVSDLMQSLTHASMRIITARAASGDERDCETDRVLTDISDAMSAIQRLARNFRENYPAEGHELDKASMMTAADQQRAAARAIDKAEITAHMVQAILYEQGHALRHAQVMHDADSDDPMWNFDADHCAAHAAKAIDHARRLSDHLKGSYPDEARWLAKIRTVPGQQHLAVMNGNGRAH